MFTIRRILYAVVIFSISFFLFGCLQEPPAETTASESILQEIDPTAEETAAAVPTEAAPEPEETQPEAPEGKVYLTVSKIIFTLVGESEDIYMGTANAEDVTWFSEDERIITVENGILTAVAPGSTVIHADLNGQHWSCEAECLAADETSLLSTDFKTRNSAKRLPAVTDYDPIPFFSETAIVGDSISMIFGQMEMKSNALGHPLFLARGGCSINGYLKHYKELFYKGQETPLADAIADSGVKRIFMMLGQNDLGYLTVEESLENYEALISVIREKNPDLVIFLQTCTPELSEGGYPSGENRKLYEFNERLPELAEKNGCGLVDMAIYAENHFGALAPEYCYDLGIHLNYDGCLMWAQVLKNFAEVYEYKMEETK